MSGESDREAHGAGLFVWVWAGLLGLTLAEVLLAYQHVAVMAMLFLLLGLSLVKAGLILGYFMHLRFEKLSLTLTLMPSLAFCIGLLLVFFPDSLRLLKLGH